MTSAWFAFLGRNPLSTGTLLHVMILAGMKKERHEALCPKSGAHVTVPGSVRSVAAVKP
jgi:hypothetical protein